MVVLVLLFVLFVVRLRPALGGTVRRHNRATGSGTCESADRAEPLAVHPGTPDKPTKVPTPPHPTPGRPAPVQAGAGIGKIHSLS